jgi:hypothetical protein
MQVNVDGVNVDEVKFVVVIARSPRSSFRRWSGAVV